MTYFCCAQILRREFLMARLKVEHINLLNWAEAAAATRLIPSVQQSLDKWRTMLSDKGRELSVRQWHEAGSSETVWSTWEQTWAARTATTASISFTLTCSLSPCWREFNWMWWSLHKKQRCDVGCHQDSYKYKNTSCCLCLIQREDFLVIPELA